MRAHEIAALLATSEPVSFYDIVTILRRLGAGDPDDAVLARLLELHAAPHLTDGARDQLDRYLRSLATRHDKERQLARSRLAYDSNGRTVRAPAGSTLRIRLDERPKASLRWEVARSSGPLLCTLRPSPRAHEQVTELEVRLKTPGRGRLELAETGPGSPHAKPRAYVLEIAIERRRP